MGATTSPEYRQISQLREHFRKFVHGAHRHRHRRVREDIIKHLKLHEPKCLRRQLQSPDLTYRVIARTNP